MDSLVNFSLLELLDHIQIRLFNWAVFELTERSGIIAEIQKVDLAFMFFIEIGDEAFELSIIPEFNDGMGTWLN